MDAQNGRVGDERHRPVPRNELAEPSERAELVVHAGGPEDDAVDVAIRDDCIGHLAIERPTVVVQAPELLLVLRQGAFAADALPRGLHVDVEQHGVRRSGQSLAHRGRRHGTAAEAEHPRRAAVERQARVPGLLNAKERLALQLEHLIDVADLPGNDLVDLDRLAIEQARDLRSEGGLPRSHEPDQGNVPVECVQRHAMRVR